MANFKLPELKQGTRAADRFEKNADRHSTSDTVRITVDLDADLHRRLKIKAAMEGKRIADLVREWTDENTSGLESS